MTSDERSRELPREHLDTLTPAQARRFQLWRAMADLSKAQSDGRLSPEQARLLGALADSLQQLSTQLNQLAELGQQCAQLLESGRAPAGPSPVLEAGRTQERPEA